ncbi:MAG: lysoplasmalogenase [Anaerolineae bacterium]
MILWGAFGVALALAALDWVMVWRQDRRRRYVTKPAAMVAVTAAAGLLILGWPHDPWQAIAFLFGFFLSLAGDIFLMLPDERMFLPGLAAFLLAHLCYIVGLNQTLPPAPALLLAAPLALAGAFLFLRIRAGMVRSGHAGLAPAIALYSLVISVMLWSAWATLFRSPVQWPLARQALVVTGATLFFISDGTLAWNRFVRPLQYGNLAVMVTYHLAQLAFAASLALTF